MDNLKDLYYFERHNGIVRSRYTIKQIIIDLITVPEQILQACKVMRRMGASLYLKPNFYTLRYFEEVQKAAPTMHIDDLLHITWIVGQFLANGGNRLHYDKIEIQEGTRILNGYRPERHKWISQELITGPSSGKQYCVQIHRVPNYDNGTY